jgi:hypothetical protein
MKSRPIPILFLIIVTVFVMPIYAQEPTSAQTVPSVINYSGLLTDLGKPLSGVQGVTFLLYSSEQGGDPLWMETQNVSVAKNGQYSVILGSTTSQGLPADIFSSGEARWLAVQVVGQVEQPRVLLVAVPYALKAADAQTVGGLPPSAFVLANAAKNDSKAPASAVTGSGTADYIPMWNSASDIVNSVLYQKATDIGIGTTAPAATLDVNGKGDVRDTLTLFPKTTDETLAINGTAFNISSTGKVTFVSGQTFPGTGTLSGITTASGSGLSGGGTSGTLSLKIPAAGVTNAMLADSKITLNANSAGGLTTPGAMTLGSIYTIGLQPCSAKQVLQYSGTAWGCSSVGTGTITGVTAGTGLSGGGTIGTVMLKNTGLLGLAAGSGITVGSGQTPVVSVASTVPLLSNNNAFTGASNTFTGKIAIGTSTPSSYAPLLVTGNSSNSAGIQTITTNASTSTNSFATFSAQANGVNAEFYADGLGTSPLGTPGAIFGTYSNNPIAFIAGNKPQLFIYPSGLIGIGTTSPGAKLEIDNALSADALNVFNSSAGTNAIYGNAQATTGPGVGVYGATFSSAANSYGVLGSTVGTTGAPIGTYGITQSVTGVGVFGQSVSESIQGQNLGASNKGAGVWGDGGVGGGASSSIGVLGSADDGAAAEFFNDSSSGYPTVYVAEDSGEADPFLAQGVNGSCSIDDGGDLSCTGTKNAVVPVDGGLRIVAMSAIESPVNWFEDAGESRLSNGASIVEMDATYLQTVNTGMKYQVFLTPYGDCKGLYVSNRTTNSFEVHELGGGTSSIAFGYRIMAVRKNYESVRFADHTHKFDVLKRMQERMKASGVMPVSHDPKQKPPISAKPRTAINANVDNRDAAQSLLTTK